jgi:hypothetical protein
MQNRFIINDLASADGGVGIRLMRLIVIGIASNRPTIAETVSEVVRWWKPTLHSAASGIGSRSDRREAIVSAATLLPTLSSSRAGANPVPPQWAS